MKKRVFIIDDEPGIIKIARILLEGEGYAVYEETNPEKAFEKIKSDLPDLILLDICMPEMNGLDFCRKLKNIPKLSQIPIIFISVRADEADVVAGLELGADDYVQKPLRERELLARVRTVFRKQGLHQKPHRLELGPLRMDFEAYKAWLKKTPLSLTPKQFELLSLLVHNEGKVLTRSTISQSVWGADFSKMTRTIDTTVDQIRRQLGRHRTWIQSLKGIGYRFEMDL